MQKYLERCIKLVCNQSHKNLEIILINDGFTDKSVNICNKYASMDSRIKILHRTHGGAASARNLGLSII